MITSQLTLSPQASRILPFRGTLAFAPLPLARALPHSANSRYVKVTCSQNPEVQDCLQNSINRRTTLALSATVLFASTSSGNHAEAIQGLVAGRIPGTTSSDIEGFNSYTRPSGKSGGHGVGWSEIQPYTFLVPENFQEVPVSIADLGGAEVDLRFSDKVGGDLAVVVAPVLRFADVGFNADVTIEELATPQKLISAFAPELTGNPLEEENLIDIGTSSDDSGLVYYNYELKSPHTLIRATAVKNRLFIITVRGSSSAWRKNQKDFRLIRDTFRVENTA